VDPEVTKNEWEKWRPQRVTVRDPDWSRYMLHYLGRGLEETDVVVLPLQGCTENVTNAGKAKEEFGETTPLTQIMNEAFDKFHRAYMARSHEKAENAAAPAGPGSHKTGLMCPGCGNMKQPEELKACTRCKFISYCSRECQTKCWKKHKKYCCPPAAAKADDAKYLGNNYGEGGGDEELPEGGPEGDELDDDKPTIEIEDAVACEKVEG
jgi:hypothetical protein